MSGMVVKAVYTVSELAALSGIHRSTIYGWVKSGKIPATKYGPKTVLISLQAFRAAFPEVWESIRLLHSMRNGKCQACGAALDA